jgi:hypothetical protein
LRFEFPQLLEGHRGGGVADVWCQVPDGRAAVGRSDALGGAHLDVGGQREAEAAGAQVGGDEHERLLAHR